MNDLNEGNPLPEFSPETEPQRVLPADHLAHQPIILEENTPELTNDTIIEGQFIENLPPQGPPPASTALPAGAKRKLNPAMLALITILGLFVLCCLMAIIIFFMVYPAARADGSVLVIPLSALLFG